MNVPGAMKIALREILILAGVIVVSFCLRMLDVGVSFQSPPRVSKVVIMILGYSPLFILGCYASYLAIRIKRILKNK